MPRTEKRPAAYIPFKTFETAVKALEQALPDQIDKSAWPTFSYATQAHTVSAFKFLGLIDDDGHVQDDLRQLVAEKGNRPALVGELLRKSYPNVVELSDQNATPKQLQDAIGQHHVAGTLRVKAVRFFLKAAEYAELPISPLWNTGRKTVATGQARRTRKATRSKRTPDADSGVGSASELSMKVVNLPVSGGTLRLSASVDVMKLVGDERKFVFDLVDMMDSFSEAHQPSTNGTSDEGPSEDDGPAETEEADAGGEAAEEVNPST